MFDLDKSILDWKRSFQQSCTVDEASIEELESHLRESVDGLQRKGLSEEESFVIALKRLGHGPTLNAEFKKNNPLGVNQDRLIWMLSGYLGISLCGLLSTAIVSSLSTAMAYAGLGSTFTGVVATLCQILFWVGMFVLAARAREVTFAFGKYPALSLIVMFVAMVTLPLISPLANMAQTRVADQKWMVETYYWIGFGHLAVQLLIYAFCFIALFKIRLSRGSPAVSQQ